MIEVKNLVKKYGNHLAVDHLDFQIKPGMVYGFLGPNGAGKSTTMNIMTGCMGATQGEVLINGYDILKEPEKAKRYIGYLPEHPPLYMDMTVREYLDFAAELKGIRKSQRREAVDEAEKMVKVQDVEHRLIRNLSKGYRQRVGLAQAILGFPDMIILDEVNYAVKFGLINEADVFKIIDNKPEQMHLVLTGRDAAAGVIEKADLVTEMKEIKHPYKKGIKAQKGIEF